MAVKVNLAQILGVSPPKTIKFLAVPLGSKVKKGDILAIKKNFWGKVVRVSSQIDGVLETLSQETGELLIREVSDTLPKKKEKTAEPPQVKQPILSKPKASGNVVGGIFGFGHTQAELVYIDGDLEFTKLKPSLVGKAVLSDSISSTASLFKAHALGVKAIIVSGASAELLEEIDQSFEHKKDFVFLVLGDKEEKPAQALKRLVGKEVTIDGEAKEVYAIKK